MLSERISVFALILAIAISCSGPQAYLRKAVRIMDANGLYAEGAEWEATREHALSQRPATVEEAQAVVCEALEVAGGRHSFFLPWENVKAITEMEWRMPSVDILDCGVAVITLPDFSGGEDDGRSYARNVVDAVPDDISGAIIDLRGNTGGNMYPMIAAVHRFIKDGDDMLRFRSRNHTNSVPLDFILRCEGMEREAFLDCPVAILTDSLTASSGEATLICFRGQENVKTFGTPTAGYASANRSFRMPDGSSLVLTTGRDVARTGEEFCDDPIVPDVHTDNPMEDAINWLKK
ncbi:MAG: S41 family peptidase [Bacteroidia bacterium]|nr:S41 family peptidase [Bacteroidia bacterium]